MAIRASPIEQAYPVGRHPLLRGDVVARCPAHLEGLVPCMEIEQQAWVFVHRFEEPRLDLADSCLVVFALEDSRGLLLSTISMTGRAR